MERMQGALIGIMSMIYVLMLCPSVQAGQTAEETALVAANEWLSLIDQGKYPESWETTSGYFKASIKRDQWESAVAAARKPLGNLLSRKVISKQYKTELPGAPDGEYVVIQYKSSFEHKKAALERVTPMRDDGTWKVSGYYIQ